MKVNKRIALYVAGIAGCVLLVIVGLLLKGEDLKALSGVSIGVGAGVFGMLVGSLVTFVIESRNPEAFRAKKIEEKDERNAAIRDKSGARTNRVMASVLPVVTLVFVLMGVDLAITLIMCGIILLQGGVSIYFSVYYGKRM